MSVRSATADDLLPVMRLLDGAALEADIDAIRTRIESADVWLYADDGPPAGVVVLDGGTVEAVAVRRGRRDQGIGRTLVEAARNRRGRLVAEFDERVRPFYAAMDFDIHELEGTSDRYRGVFD